MHESSLQAQVLKYLNSLPSCIAENVSGDSSQSGRSDISGCWKKRAFRIELKVTDNGNKPSKKQLFELLRWQKAGAIVMVAYTLNDIKQVFKRSGFPCDGWVRHHGKNMTAFMCCHKNDTLIGSMLKEYEL